jgi:hypothetical protein
MSFHLLLIYKPPSPDKTILIPKLKTIDIFELDYFIVNRQTHKKHKEKNLLIILIINDIGTDDRIVVGS